MASIDDLAEEIMQGLQEYADLADTAMKKAVRKTATQVKNEISANAPKDTGKYAKSWATKKTGESQSFFMAGMLEGSLCGEWQITCRLKKCFVERGIVRGSSFPTIKAFCSQIW